MPLCSSCGPAHTSTHTHHNPAHTHSQQSCQSIAVPPPPPPPNPPYPPTHVQQACQVLDVPPLPQQVGLVHHHHSTAQREGLCRPLAAVHGPPVVEQGLQGTWSHRGPRMGVVGGCWAAGGREKVRTHVLTTQLLPMYQHHPAHRARGRVCLPLYSTSATTLLGQGLALPSFIHTNTHSPPHLGL